MELLEQIDENDGLPEIFFQKSTELLKYVQFVVSVNKYFLFVIFLTTPCLKKNCANLSFAVTLSNLNRL